MPVRPHSLVRTLLFISLLFALAACSSPANPGAQPAPTSGLPAATAQPTSAPVTAATAVAEAPTAPPAGNATSVDACALLSKADAEKILGQPVKDPESPVQGSADFNVSSCVYHTQTGTALDRVALVVWVVASGDAAYAKTAFETDKQKVPANYNADPVDVAGVGDAAYWVAGAGNQLMVLKGTVQFSLLASTQKGDTASPEIVDLAKLVISRLP